jgi:hypothetical protein
VVYDSEFQLLILNLVMLLILNLNMLKLLNMEKIIVSVSCSIFLFYIFYCLFC